MVKMHAMLEMKVALLLMFKTTEKALSCLWMPLRRQATLERSAVILFYFPPFQCGPPFFFFVTYNTVNPSYCRLKLEWMLQHQSFLQRMEAMT